MKNLSLIITFLLITSISLFAQVNTNTANSEADPDVATVIIYRTPEFNKSAANWGIFNNRERICKLSNKKYMVYKTKPGDSDFRGQVWGILKWPEKQQGLEIQMEAGKVYYIKADVKLGAFADARMELTEVTENSASNEIKNLKPDRCISKP